MTGAGIHRAPDIRTAEAAKVIENAQRDINIAFINEVAMIFGDLGLSVYDVLDAARSKWNFIDFRPGLVGGHCIGVDPFYLAYCAQQLGHEAEVILAGRRINDGMGDYLARRIADAAHALGLGGKPRSLVLGLTFKENLPDLRNSKVVDLIQGLQRRGHDVSVHDPRAEASEAKAVYGIELCADPFAASAGGFDCLIGAVAHDQYRDMSSSDLGRLVQAGRPHRRYQGDLAGAGTAPRPSALAALGSTIPRPLDGRGLKQGRGTYLPSAKTGWANFSSRGLLAWFTSCFSGITRYWFPGKLEQPLISRMRTDRVQIRIVLEPELHVT